MNSQSNTHFKLGLFVILAVALLIGGALALGAGSFLRKRVYFETYIEESVHGLAVGSPVKNRGVKVGSVEEIDFVRNAYPLDTRDSEKRRMGQLVRIVCSLRADVLQDSSEAAVEELVQVAVRDGMRVRMAMEGITGLAYLEVDFVEPGLDVTGEVPWIPELPYLPAASSVMNRWSASLDLLFNELEAVDIEGIAKNLDQLVVRLDQTLEEARIGELSTSVDLTLTEAREALRSARALLEGEDPHGLLAKGSVILDDLAAAIASAESSIQGLGELAPEARSTLAHVDRLLTSEELDNILENASSASSNLELALRDLPQLAGQLAETLRRIDVLVADPQRSLARVIENLDAISNHARRLTSDAERNPSRVLTGDPPAPARARQ